MAAPEVHDRPLYGIALAIAAVSTFAVMSALIKAAGRVPAGEAVFFRSVLTLPALLGWAAATGRLALLRTGNWTGHAWRGIVGTTAMGLGFTGLKFLPLPEVTALQFATPILIVLFAAVMLGEPVRLIRLSAVGVGLLGVVIIVWPRISAEGSTRELIGAGIVLTAAGCAAMAQIFVKRMAGTEPVIAIVFYFSLTATVLALGTVPFGWVVPRGVEWVWLLGAGVIGGVGQILLTSSYRYAPASVLAPFTYVSMLWAIGIGWSVFGEAPTLPMLAGSALVIGAGIAIVLRERALGIRRAAEAKLRAKAFQ